MCLKCGWSVEIPWKNYGSRVLQFFFPFSRYGTQAECGISVMELKCGINVKIMWNLSDHNKHIEWILCGTSVEFFYIPNCGTSDPQYGIMEFYNVELVWNSEFHINKKASEIKQCTGIHDHSSTMCHNWALWGGMFLPFWCLHCICCGENWSLQINSLRLLTYLILTLGTICVKLVLTNWV